MMMSQKGLTPRSTPISSEKLSELLLDLVVEGSDPLVLRHLLFKCGKSCYESRDK
jgi:hypothetical protein